MLRESAHLLFLLAACLGVLAACVWAYRRSPSWGVIVGVGAIVRLASGLLLLAISYYQWPVFQSLHTGDGYWLIAPDARVYFEKAAAAAAYGTSLAVPAGSPSPVYVIALGFWYRAGGATLASAVVFNLVCHIVSVVAIILILPRQARRIGNLVLFSVSFSPALLMTSTQVLKDPFFVMLIVVGCVAALLILRYSRDTRSAPPSRLTAGVLVAAAAVAAMAGVRAYYALFVWIAVAGAFLVSIVTVRGRHRVRLAAFAAPVLVLLWVAFAMGSDVYYTYYRDLIARTTGINLSALALIGRDTRPVISGSADVGELGTAMDSVRIGFIGSGGGTNIKSRTALNLTRQGLEQAASDLALGLAVTFIPISALRATSMVDFNGGRGLLAITDLDTLFMDVTLLAIAIAIFRLHGVNRYNVASLVLVVTLAAISAVVVAYVVTNFGTLFRLRLLTAVPAWLAPLALTTGPVREWIRSETGQANPSAVTVPADKDEGFEI